MTPVAYDVTRLFLGPLSRGPRGIDRVDLEYALHFFGDPARECVGIMPTPLGMRAFPRERVIAGLKRLQDLWAETVEARDDPVWTYLQGILCGTPGTSPPRRTPFGTWTKTRRMASMLASVGLGPGRSARSGAPKDAVYLNVGQIGLAVPRFLHWLDERPDVRPAFMLHDAIPLETPEYVSAFAVKNHSAMVASTAKRAAGLLVTTAAARDAIATELRKCGRNHIATWTCPLAVPSIFTRPVPPVPLALKGVNYFVVCGAIEQRKNHVLLLEVWKRIAAQAGESTPHLVIVGEVGRHGEIVQDWLTQSPQARSRIHLASGLSTPGLIELLAGARALLMPSFIEGFGLPLIEAAALGRPVIASDIAAHREIAPPGTVLINPLDGPAWQRAIVAAAVDMENPPDKVAAGSRFFSDWPSYFASLELFLATLAPL